MSKILILITIAFSLTAGAEDLGLCYSSESRSTKLVTSEELSSLDSIPLNVRHWLAMKASQLVYKLSDLEKAKTGEELIEMHKAFRSEALPDYEQWDYHSDRSSGLKYAIFAPLNPSDPWIFAFAGTETALDWMADLNLGRAQLEQVEDMVEHLTNCKQVDKVGRPIASRNWIITGHSLGGGLAQAFAFKAQSRRMLLRLIPNRIELVTFNAFGALDLVTPTPETADIVVPQMRTANYFVTSDVVSKIGRHLGQTYELEMPSAGSNLKEIVNRHFMTTIENWVMKNGHPEFHMAESVAPPESQTLRALKKYAYHLGFLVEESTAGLAGRYAQLRVLEEAAEVVLARQMSEPFDRDALRYVANLSTAFAAELRAQVYHPLRQQQIEALERLTFRINKILL